MWDSDQFDHSLIQVSVGELDGVAEGDAEGLLACGTSCVTENYEREGRWRFSSVKYLREKEGLDSGWKKQ